MDLLYYSHLIYMCNVCFPILLLRRTETKLEYFADTHIFLKQRHSSYNYTYFGISRKFTYAFTTLLNKILQIINYFTTFCDGI